MANFFKLYHYPFLRRIYQWIELKLVVFGYIFLFTVLLLGLLSLLVGVISMTIDALRGGPK